MIQKIIEFYQNFRMDKKDKIVLSMIKSQDYNSLLEIINSDYVITQNSMSQLLESMVSITPTFGAINDQTSTRLNLVATLRKNEHKYHKYTNQYQGLLLKKLFPKIDVTNYILKDKRNFIKVTINEIDSNQYNLNEITKYSYIVWIFGKSILKSDILLGANIIESANTSIKKLEHAVELKNKTNQSCIVEKNILNNYKTLKSYLTQAKNSMNQELIENITQIEKIQVQIMHSENNQLNSTVKDKLIEIEKSFYEINKNIYNTEEEFIINKLYNERIPKLIENFLSIDVEHRGSIKNSQGYNAQELLSQSLNEISSIFMKTLERTKIEESQDKLRQLNVQARYVSSLK